MREIIMKKSNNNTEDSKWIQNLMNKTADEAILTAECTRNIIKDMFGEENANRICTFTDENNRTIIELITIRSLREHVIQNKFMYEPTITKQIAQTMLTEWFEKASHKE